ncbi:hypothetical protein KAS41_01855 [Candidatus Parcubacteria bacterium]|nr:hypothetical protein [Candidatus Parcubacteria bacterium]
MPNVLNIKKAEYRLVFIVSVIIIILTTAPYLFGYFNAPAGHQYLGIHLAPADLFVYESYIAQAKNGNFLLENLFHNELPAEKNINIFWLIIGLFAKIFNLAPIIAFHISRIFLIPICLICLYWLIAYFFQDVLKRKTALIITAFSSGLGAVFSVSLQFFEYYDDNLGYYNWPLDLWSAESHLFLSFYQTPHFIASFVCLILIFLFFLLSFRTNKIKFSFLAGVIALFFFNFHPFFLITFFSVIPTYLIVIFLLKQKKNFLNGLKHFFVICFISSPSILYHFLNFLFNPIVQQKAEQNLCKTTSLFLTIISYGIPLFLAIYAIYYLIKNKKIDNRNLFLIVWLMINFIIIYLPFLKFQRRLVEGMQIPIAFLATIALFVIYNKLKEKKILPFFQNKLSFFCLMVILSISNIYVMLDNTALIYKQHPIFYIPNENIEAMGWMKKNIDLNKTTISHPMIGNFIPAKADRRVYCGHWVETVNYQEKRARVLWIFKGNNKDDQKKEFLRNSRIDYIFYSDYEKSLGEFQPPEKDYLEKVYQNEEVEIYKVKI